MDKDVMFSSGSEMWGSPDPLFQQISGVFGPFTLDPCATRANRKADHWFGDVTNDGHQPVFGPGMGGEVITFIDGLSRRWRAHDGSPGNVFVNPPFCRDKKMYVEPWIEYGLDQVQLGNSAQVVMLIPARTETRVWQHTVFQHADYIGFIKGRVKFVRPDGTDGPAPFPSAIVVFRGQHGRLRIPPYITAWEQP